MTRTVRTTTRSRRRIAFCVAALSPLAAVVPAMANTPEGSFCDMPQRAICLTVTRSDGLGAVNTVQVSGTGFQPGQHVDIFQISTKPGAGEPDQVGNMNNVSTQIGGADADDTGAWGPISVTINRTFTGFRNTASADSASRTCASQDDCIVWTASPGPYWSQRGATHHLSFTP